MKKNSDQFYSTLAISNLSLSDLLLKTDLFRGIPESWHVIITDIKNSTSAVQNERQQNVNLIAAGSIVCVMNVANKLGIPVPFFFGGDGATFMVPATLLKEVLPALQLFRANTMDNFQLELRVGTVPVQQVYEAGHQINIARFRYSEKFIIPIVLGNGLSYAEQIIKGDNYALQPLEQIDEELRMQGLQCRWDVIPPPEDTEEVVSLLVIAANIAQQHLVFSDVIKKIDEIYGSPEKRQPISISKLKLKTSFHKLGTEMKLRIGKVKWMSLLRNWFLTAIGVFYFKTSKGKEYLNSLVAMSDTMVIDGKINTIISGTIGQRNQLNDALAAMESDGQLLYGLYVSGSSIMSCYVNDFKENHIHFVDGSEGGYTRAAQVLKGKIKNLTS